MSLDYTVVFRGGGLHSGIKIHISVEGKTEEFAKRNAWVTLANGMKAPLDEFEIVQVIPYFMRKPDESHQGS